LRQSGVYALGAVRMRQGLGLSRHGHEQRLSLLKRYIANVIEEIRGEMPIARVNSFIAAGGDARFAAAQILDTEDNPREIPRDAFFAFCDALEGETEERLVERYRLPAAEIETLMPAMLVYRALLADTRAATVVVPAASLRAGVLLDMTTENGREGEEDFELQVLASAEALGRRYRFDAEHGRAVMNLSVRLFEQLQEEHGLGRRERLLLQVAALLHDIGIFISLRSHHKHSQYLLSASQIFGLSDDDLALVSNVSRYHRRGLPQKSHLPYIALDRHDRMIVNKLSAILRLANALDAEHLQKVRDIMLQRHQDDWVLEIEGTGDLTMERMASQARADMFGEVFGHRLIVRGGGVGA
jgi:exopolyphosphatase/guanosine-5'-triphosphate,3'-diphosphate pyrophosphatase